MTWLKLLVTGVVVEWYPRNMHLKDSKEHAHHVEKYGDPVEFGYDKFVPMFKATARFPTISSKCSWAWASGFGSMARPSTRRAPG